MNLKIVIFYSFLFILFTGCQERKQLPYEKQVLKETWISFEIEDLGSIHIPPSLELQNESIKKEVFEFSNSTNFTLNSDRIVFQQQGFNKLKENFNGKYARVIIETEKGETAEFDSLNYKPKNINELDIDFLINVNNSFKETDFKLIDWLGTESVEVNGMYPTKYSYIRQFLEETPVLVETYIFSNYDRIHSLTFSYRISEKEYWSEDFRVILDSFLITNIRNRPYSKESNVQFSNTEQIALELAKYSFSYGSISNERHIKNIIQEAEGDINIEGWKTLEIDIETYLVAFIYYQNSQKRGFALEVKPDYEIVREVWRGQVPNSV